jgi:hypothetical protein
MFVDQGTIEEIECALLNISLVQSVEVGEFYENGKLGLRICSILDNGYRRNRFEIYSVESELITRLPGILLEFSTRISCPNTLVSDG